MQKLVLKEKTKLQLIFRCRLSSIFFPWLRPQRSDLEGPSYPCIHCIQLASVLKAGIFWDLDILKSKLFCHLCSIFQPPSHKPIHSSLKGLWYDGIYHEGTSDMTKVTLEKSLGETFLWNISELVLGQLANYEKLLRLFFYYVFFLNIVASVLKSCINFKFFLKKMN